MNKQEYKFEKSNYTISYEKINENQFNIYTYNNITRKNDTLIYRNNSQKTTEELVSFGNHIIDKVYKENFKIKRIMIDDISDGCYSIAIDFMKIENGEDMGGLIEPFRYRSETYRNMVNDFLNNLIDFFEWDENK